MKKNFLICGQLLTAVLPTSAGIYTYSGPAYTIPDGNPNGVWSSITVSGETAALSHLSVTLNVNGGYNGDLYAYLSYGGRMVPLLNRTGVSSGNSFGSSGAGMNVTLIDSATGNIHAASDSYLGGSYRADGQNISPLSGATAFNVNGGSITLDGTFGNFDPNGVWTLFFSDVVSSGNPSTLNSWILSTTVVPEPSMAALTFGLTFVGAWRGRWKTSK